MRSIAIITSQAFSLLNFRGPLIRAIVAKGVKVYALAPDFDNESKALVIGLGAVPVEISLSRTGINPILGLIDTLKLVRLLHQLKPECVLSYFIKPVIFGSIAAWLARVPNRFSMIEGLGYGFEDSRNIFRRAFRLVLILLFWFAIDKNKRVFILNPDDLALLLKLRITSHDKICQIDGIGLDLDWYVPAPPVVDPITFILVARMIREKGVWDYVGAARLVKEKVPRVRFLLVGGADLNPGSIKEEELQGWASDGLVDWVGRVGDVRPWLAQASVFVLPSYYREGLPRSSQEAMAMSRPVITTDWVGCRNTVTNGLNGFLVPIRNPEALATAMMRFVESPDLVESMGRNGRLIAESRFNVHAINDKIMDVLGLFELSESSSPRVDIK